MNLILLAIEAKLRKVGANFDSKFWYPFVKWVLFKNNLIYCFDRDRGPDQVESK